MACVLLVCAAVGGAVGGTLGAAALKKTSSSTSASGPLLTVKLVQSTAVVGGAAGGRRLQAAQGSTSSVQLFRLHVLNFVLERPNGVYGSQSLNGGPQMAMPQYVGVSLFNGTVWNNTGGGGNSFPTAPTPYMPTTSGSVQMSMGTYCPLAAAKTAGSGAWVDLANQSDVDTQLGRSVAVPPGTYTFFTVQYGPLATVQGSAAVVNTTTGQPSGVTYYTRACGTLACGAKCQDAPLASCSNGGQYTSARVVTPAVGGALGAVSAQGDVWTSTAGLPNVWPPGNQTNSKIYHNGMPAPPFKTLGTGDGFWMRGCPSSLATGPTEQVTVALGFSGLVPDQMYSSRFLQPVVVPQNVSGNATRMRLAVAYSLNGALSPTQTPQSNGTGTWMYSGIPQMGAQPSDSSGTFTIDPDSCNQPGICQPNHNTPNGTPNYSSDDRHQTLTDGFNVLQIDVPVLAPILHFETDVVWRLSYTISPLAVPVPVCFSGAGGYAGAGTVNYTGPYTGFDQCNGCPTPCSHWWCSGYFLNGAVYNGPCGPNTFGDIDRPPSFFSPPPPALPGYVNPRTSCAWNAAAPPRFLPFNVEVYALGSTTGPDLARVQQAMVTGRWLIHGYMETRNLVYNVTTPSGGGSPTLSVSKAFFSVHDVPEGQPFTPLPLITGLSLHTTLGASLGGTLYNYNPPQPNDTPVHAACFGMLQVNTTLVGIDALPS